jgi:hypothetical protein
VLPGRSHDEAEELASATVRPDSREITTLIRRTFVQTGNFLRAPDSIYPVRVCIDLRISTTPRSKLRVCIGHQAQYIDSVHPAAWCMRAPATPGPVLPSVFFP